jgi:hypothetical protein
MKLRTQFSLVKKYRRSGFHARADADRGALQRAGGCTTLGWQEGIMKSLRVLFAVLLPSALWFAAGCAPAELTDAEFASQVMRVVADKGYINENASKVPPAPFYDENGLAITLGYGDFDLSDDYAEATLVVSFTAFELDNSTVDGSLEVSVEIVASGSKPQTFMAVFNTIAEPVPEPLVVTGKHAGQYEFADATVVYDFAAHDYTFSGAVIVDGVTHNL